MKYEEVEKIVYSEGDMVVLIKNKEEKRFLLIKCKGNGYVGAIDVDTSHLEYYYDGKKGFHTVVDSILEDNEPSSWKLIKSDNVEMKISK